MMTEENKDSVEYILCGCGCGTKITKYDKQGRPRKYLNRSHSGRSTFLGKKHSDTTKEKISKVRTKSDEERKIVVSNGYRFLSIRGHPNADKDGYIAEHRYVMSQILGRPLKSNEDVHHKNKNRSDNRPENLQLYTDSSHMVEHRKEYQESIIGRTCGLCGTDKTQISKKMDRKTGRVYYTPMWRTNPLNRSQWLCHRCHARTIDRIKNNRRILS